MSLVMTLLAVAAGTAAALLGLLAARLSRPGAVGRQAGWLGVALGCYSFVAIPVSSVSLPGVDVGPVLSAVQVLTPCLLVALLLVALIDPPWTRHRAAAAVLLAVCPVVVVSVTMAAPRAYRAAWTSRIDLGLALVWTVLGLVVAVRAARRRTGALGLVATGIALLGAWHAVLVVGAAAPFGDGLPTVPGLRLAAVVLVLCGTLTLLRRAMLDLEAVRDAHEEELRLAEIQLARAAERDHEIRCGLAGLAGAARLRGTARPDAEPLDSLVMSELDRLEVLLQTPAVGPHEAPTTSYDVEPVLSGLVALRRAAGMSLHLEVEPDLRAVGSSATLAQVVANLIANAERHAPGSRVRISARARGGRVSVVLRDSGPGVAPGREEFVFEAGVCDQRGGGTGLGLDVCRRLLAAEGGSIAVCPFDPGDPGCVVVLELQASPAAEEATAPGGPTDVSCAAS